jgi:hypothetical protein
MTLPIGQTNQLLRFFFLWPPGEKGRGPAVQEPDLERADAEKGSVRAWAGAGGASCRPDRQDGAGWCESGEEEVGCGRAFWYKYSQIDKLWLGKVLKISGRSCCRQLLGYGILPCGAVRGAAIDHAARPPHWSRGVDMRAARTTFLTKILLGSMSMQENFTPAW